MSTTLIPATAPPPARVDLSGIGPPLHGAGALRQVLVLSGRSLRVLREPALLVPNLIEPFLLLLLFSQVFRSLAQVPSFPDGVSYIDYLLPAVLISMGMTSGVKSGLLLSTDLRNGVITRFRTMPLWTGAVLLARSFADAALNAVELLFLLVIGALLFGYAPAGGIAGALGAMLVALSLAWSVGWVFMALTTLLRRPESLQQIGGMLTFPLMFASNAFVTTDGLPTWLRAFAEVNPLTHAINAARGLALGAATPSMVLWPLCMCAVTVLVAAPVAMRGFRRP
ncbi:ABC transporter permease [Micromonospora tarensis]|uniref:Transport permease protein n=1 Tax=Micromonospora tarensis TaxID=2806100 RepID=A0ABS1YAM3_9ACTN|nr:ABC transporter permease [Micromonospora tarensis]MBM0274447.1 ABC transporter permease [Micromonospora tarensis]